MTDRERGLAFAVACVLIAAVAIGATILGAAGGKPRTRKHTGMTVASPVGAVQPAPTVAASSSAARAVAARFVRALGDWQAGRTSAVVRSAIKEATSPGIAVQVLSNPPRRGHELPEAPRVLSLDPRPTSTAGSWVVVARLRNRDGDWRLGLRVTGASGQATVTGFTSLDGEVGAER